MSRQRGSQCEKAVMGVRIAGRNMEIGEAFRLRIDGRIGETVAKYFNGGYTAQVTVEKSGSRFSSDCFVHLDTGALLQATAAGQGPQASFDAAAERLEKRLRRYKRRLRDHHASAGAGAVEAAYRIVDPGPESDGELSEDHAPAVIAESSKTVRTMTVASAVMAFDMTDEPVLVFRNAASDAVNVIYRRSDGHIGWIDPSEAPASACG